MEWSAADRGEFALYQELRTLREAGAADTEALTELAERAAQLPGAWLLQLELLELSVPGSALARELEARLKNLANSHPENAQLIERGIKLVENHPIAA